MKRLNLVFEDEDFEILKRAKGEDTWTAALVRWAKMVLEAESSK